MSEIVTRIGEVEVTPQMVSFFENIYRYDINHYMISNYVGYLFKVQDLLTRLLLDYDDFDQDLVVSCLSNVVFIKDLLESLEPDPEQTATIESPAAN